MQCYRSTGLTLSVGYRRLHASDAHRSFNFGLDADVKGKVFMLALVVAVFALTPKMFHNLASQPDPVAGTHAVLRSVKHSAASVSHMALRSVNAVAKTANDPAGCRLSDRAASVVLNPAKFPSISRHVLDAWKVGFPRVLRVDRANQITNAQKALSGLAIKDGYARSVYPPAIAHESAGMTDMMYIPDAESEAAASTIRGQLRSYCTGQRFQFAF
jgi:hypothetical protein